MGQHIDPYNLTSSGERCLTRIQDIYTLGIPTPQLITAIGTVVEVHVSDMLMRLVETSEVRETSIGDALLNELENNLTATWPNRSKWLKSGFAIQYRGSAAADDYDVLIDMRNAVVHGDGAFSPVQRRMALPKLQTLKRRISHVLRIEMQGVAEYGESSSEASVGVARAFVQHFDKCLLAKYSHHRLGAIN